MSETTVQHSDLRSVSDATTLIKFTVFLLSSGNRGERFARRLWQELSLDDTTNECVVAIHSAIDTLKYAVDESMFARLRVVCGVPTESIEDRALPVYTLGQLLKYPKYGVGRFKGIDGDCVRLEYSGGDLLLESDRWSDLELVSGFRRLDHYTKRT